MNEKDKKMNTGLLTPPDSPPSSPVLKPIKITQEQSLDQATNKIIEEQEKTKEFLKEKENKIWKLKTELNSLKSQLKTLLGIKLLEELPSNWVYQLVKKSELLSTQAQLKEWEDKFPNTTPQEISYKITQLKSEKSEVERELKEVQPPKTAVIYFCDICLATKNSKVDGEAYRIKITSQPNVISNVCPDCRPQVAMVHEADKKRIF